MPIGSKGSLVFIAGRGLAPSPMAKWNVPFKQPARYTISGVTKNSTGAALGGCTVEIYEVAPKGAWVMNGEGNEPQGKLRGSVVSAADGTYSLDVTSNETGLTFQARAYLAGSPDRAGVTLNTLTVSATTDIYLRDPTAADGPGGSAVFRPVGSPVVRRISQ